MIRRGSRIKVSLKFLLLGIGCGVMLSSCWTTEGNSKGISLDVSKTKQIDSTAVVQAVHFVPDTLVNNRLALRDFNGIVQGMLQKKDQNVVEKLRESPVFVFVNQDHTSYLLAYQYEGAMAYAFDCFEIGYTKDLGQTKGEVKVDESFFVLGSGLKLGLSLAELVEIKGSAYDQEENQITYRIDDYRQSSFLKRYNMPAYFLTCTLTDHVITKIKFGFEQP
ncbi:hypothetical protein [Myroides fluvii]|uniref:hypothetical protein n=1 Tax=Myroides fluvii TaxID=2572594 RepID=UPI00131B1D61|nr:hypothetical protein [Myroides fluvii]